MSAAQLRKLKAASPAETDATRRCAVCGDPLVRREGEESWNFRTRQSCDSPACRTALRRRAVKQGWARRGAEAQDEEPNDPPAPPRGGFPLVYDAGVIIQPARPAPLKVYFDTRRPTPFQDDLNAIHDKGSHGPARMA